MLWLCLGGENSLLLTSAIFVLLQPLSNIGAESGAIKNGNWLRSDRNQGYTFFCSAEAFCCFKKRRRKENISFSATDSDCKAGNEVTRHFRRCHSFTKLQSVKQLSSSPAFTRSHVSLSPLADPGSHQRRASVLEVQNPQRRGVRHHLDLDSQCHGTLKDGSSACDYTSSVRSTHLKNYRCWFTWSSQNAS